MGSVDQRPSGPDGERPNGDPDAYEVVQADASERRKRLTQVGEAIEASLTPWKDPPPQMRVSQHAYRLSPGVEDLRLDEDRSCSSIAMDPVDMRLRFALCEIEAVLNCQQSGELPSAICPFGARGVRANRQGELGQEHNSLRGHERVAGLDPGHRSRSVRLSQMPGEVSVASRIYQ